MTETKHDKLLFWGCFIALIATAFGFIVRAFLIGTWGEEFNLTKTQQGEIFGVGLWPFAISIILFSLFIDKVGYKKAMIFGFVCHVVSVALTVTAKNYTQLYVATFIVALGNGSVEAYINPVVATMFKKDKTKWLNILHAGWPGGLVLGGLLLIAVSAIGGVSWKLQVALILIPTIIYGIMLVPLKFPENERVGAGVPYLDMLKEFGALGALIVMWLIVAEVARVFGAPNSFWVGLGGGIIAAIAFGAVTKSLGHPLFIFLLCIMIPLATTELGTDSWITPLMEPIMKGFGMHPGWVLVYTSFIMMVLRFFAGPIVHKLSPLGLLAASALVAALGLIFLSKASGIMILAAATLYGFGKTFFWPTMLGVVSEQAPKGGALTLNATGGVGMLGVGVIGAVFLGYIQDNSVEGTLKTDAPAIHQKVVGEKPWLFGKMNAVIPDEAAKLPADEAKQLGDLQGAATKKALATVAIFPVIMLICYLGLIMYFKSKGGYQQQHLSEHADDAIADGSEAGAEA